MGVYIDMKKPETCLRCPCFRSPWKKEIGGRVYYTRCQCMVLRKLIGVRNGDERHLIPDNGSWIFGKCPMEEAYMEDDE